MKSLNTISIVHFPLSHLATRLPIGRFYLPLLSSQYKFTLQEADGIASFLLPMLEVDPERRASAQALLSHPWLEAGAVITDAGTWATESGLGGARGLGAESGREVDGRPYSSGLCYLSDKESDLEDEVDESRDWESCDEDKDSS